MLLLIQTGCQAQKSKHSRCASIKKERAAICPAKRRDESAPASLTDRLDRDCIVIGLRLYPILFVHLGTPAVITADSHLLMVQLQFDEISMHDLMIMPGILDVLVRIIMCDELEHRVGRKSYSDITRIRQLYPTHVRPITVQLREHIGMVQFTNSQFIEPNLGAGLSIPMRFVRTTPVPGDVLQIAG